MAPKNLKTYSKNNKFTQNKNKDKQKDKIKKYINENINDIALDNVKKKKYKKIMMVSITSSEATDTSKSLHTSENSIHPIWAETTFDKLRRGTLHNLKPPPDVPNILYETTTTTESETTENFSNPINKSNENDVRKPIKPIKRLRKPHKVPNQNLKNDSETLPEDDIKLVKLTVEPEKNDRKSASNDSVLNLLTNSFKKVPFVYLERTNSCIQNSLDCSITANSLSTPNFKNFFSTSTPIHNTSKLNKIDQKFNLPTKVLITPLELSSIFQQSKKSAKQLNLKSLCEEKPAEISEKFGTSSSLKENISNNLNNTTKSIVSINQFSNNIASSTHQSSYYETHTDNKNLIGYKKKISICDAKTIAHLPNPYVKLTRIDINRKYTNINESNSLISESDNSKKFKLKIRLKNSKKQQRSIQDSIKRTSAKLHRIKTKTERKLTFTNNVTDEDTDTDTNTDSKVQKQSNSQCQIIDKELIIDLTQDFHECNEFITHRPRTYENKMATVAENITNNDSDNDDDCVICIDSPTQVIDLSSYQCDKLDIENTPKKSINHSELIIDLSNSLDDDVDDDIVDCTPIQTVESKQPADQIYLKTGKHWRRSLNMLRQRIDGYAGNTNVRKGRQWRMSLAEVLEDNNGACLQTTDNIATNTNLVKQTNQQIPVNSNPLSRRTSIRIIRTSELKQNLRDLSLLNETDASTIKETDLQVYAGIVEENLEQTGYVSIVEKDKLDGLDGIFENLSLGINRTQSGDLETRQRRTSRTSSIYDFPITARDIVLKRCNQAEPLDFDYCYSEDVLRKCHKIGEGVYGEVFLLKTAAGCATVLKVIPIEGEPLVNGERQKRFDEILSEIIIAQELSGLRDNSDNRTSCFVHVQAVRCVRGRYPTRLVDLWELYDEDRGSENDHPSIFNDDQLYIVFELEHGGRDLESYQFISAEQSYAIFVQTAFALAVAEKALKFEHRDLHWGNLLIQPTDEKEIEFVLDDEIIKIPTNGLKATIIDYTLSRVTYENVCIYNNLAEDPDLFKSAGDYQFEVYKLMQKRNCNEWEHFEPFTNILWLHYTILKMIDGARYRKPKIMKHTHNIKIMKDVSDTLLSYRSTEDFVRLFYKDNLKF